jgi:hypothetical protein
VSSFRVLLQRTQVEIHQGVMSARFSSTVKMLSYIISKIWVGVSLDQHTICLS